VFLQAAEITGGDLGIAQHDAVRRGSTVPPADSVGARARRPKALIASVPALRDSNQRVSSVQQAAGGDEPSATSEATAKAIEGND
jgi:hypothetical protein